MKMKSLIAIDNSDEHISKKKGLLSSFKDKFVDCELSKTIKVGAVSTQKVVVSSKDPIHFTSHGVFRNDLIRYVAALSDDVKMSVNGQDTTLQNFLNQLLETAVLNKNHPLNDNSRSIWIDFGYGISAPIAVQGESTMPGSNELQLIITAVKNGKHPADNELGVACFTTASMSSGGGPTDPPFSGPIHPQN